MIKVVSLNSSSYWQREQCIALRRNGAENTIDASFPFLEDTPNFCMTVSEAFDLRNALDNLIGPIKQLEPPKDCAPQDLFPATFISISDQSRLSGLLDNYPSDSEADRSARKAIRQAMGILNLATGGREY
ncbi:hypothetical protein P4H66_06240 [Paenibacillus dokdonensis]|uniref:Uncharacterized protein n=1 Tax=Paenibacillus dokdonensis TaxID=2567944 RepID=A0ABU6GI80_9BACL|nr:hypothetical protein [Paenibacillus dokdonensis]MEC0239454.1 hypothetical protein [Paenibacillus dokdonensis]